MAFQQGQSEARYYEILGVSPGASLEEIKKAYHRRVMEYHPDKVSHLGPKLRELAEREMKELNEAWAYFQKKFAEGGGRREEKTTVHCPKCLQKLAVPEGKRIRVTCPSCKTRFELIPEGTEDEEPAASGPRPEQEPPPRQEPPKIITNSIGMEFVLLPAGSFLMGSPEGVGNPDEHPQHQVTITRPFCLGKYPVTQAQWGAIMGSNPSQFRGQTHPVENVSWIDAVIFINHLNEREGHTRYRLPSEAEWEYACRAGTTTDYFFGDDAGQLDRFAWYDGNSGQSTHPVGQKEPNPWGLYDMHGNVWEWVWDWYNNWVYAASSPRDPLGPEAGNQRVLRGGSWFSAYFYYRSAVRHCYPPDYRSNSIGFRLALMMVE